MGLFDVLQQNKALAQPQASPPSPSSSPTALDANNFTFDPTALERGVKAIQELNDSPHAKEALQLAKMQEQTRQSEFMAQMESAKIRQLESSKFAEEARKERIAEEQRELRETANYQARLNATLHEKKMEDKRKADEERVERERQEFLIREKLKADQKHAIEEERRKTMLFQHELEMKVVREKTLSEFEGKRILERENKDIHLEKMREQEKITRESQKQQRELLFSQLKEAGAGISNFISDSEKLVSLATGAGLLGLAIYGSRTFVQVAGKFIESQIGKPVLVRETSRTASPIKKITAQLSKVFNAPPTTSLMDRKNLVFSKGLFNHLNWIVKSTVGTKQQGTFYRHVLLQGPPGTGKTLFARQLALNSGMDYAIISGGDISPLKENGPLQLHKLFDWANTSKRGTVLFIDEADAFLKKGREDLTDSEHLHNALTVFLQKTGTMSDKYMLVLASNLDVSKFDSAVRDRVDEVVHFSLPALNERTELWKLYLQKHIVDVNTKNATKNNSLLSLGGLFASNKKLIDVDPELLAENSPALTKLAQLSEGTSARHISKMALALRSIAYHTDFTLSASTCTRYVQWKMNESASNESFFESLNSSVDN